MQIINNKRRKSLKKKIRLTFKPSYRRNLFVILIITGLIISAGGVLAFRNNSIKNKPKPAIINTPSQSGSSEVSQNVPAPTTQVAEPQKSSKPAPVTTPPVNECPNLEKAVNDSASKYLGTTLDAIRAINKSIHDRYDSHTDSYSDLGSVQNAIDETNALLNEQYANIESSNTKAKQKACNYSRLRRIVLPPVDSNDPENWFEGANQQYQASYS